ncbi:MAG: hypothetical protein FWF59_05345 [Turicibacter sp.]|nr:hypothetical protein [Turicibacter sp.]
MWGIKAVDMLREMSEYYHEDISKWEGIKNLEAHREEIQLAWQQALTEWSSRCQTMAVNPKAAVLGLMMVVGIALVHQLG